MSHVTLPHYRHYVCFVAVLFACSFGRYDPGQMCIEVDTSSELWDEWKVYTTSTKSVGRGNRIKTGCNYEPGTGCTNDRKFSPFCFMKTTRAGEARYVNYLGQSLFKNVK